MAGEATTTYPRRARSRWRTGCLVGVVLLAGLAAMFGPHFRSSYLAYEEIRQLWVEATRLGGWAGVIEGGADFWGDALEADVDLKHTPVDDQQLARLVRMPGFRRVTTLILEETHITDRGLKLLVDQPSIHLLDVSRTGVTDQGLASIAMMRGLVVLNLSGNPISDRGIDTLVAQSESSHLRTVNLLDTRVSQAGAERLRKALFQATINLGTTDKR
jgi:hypothetical protein